MSDPFDRALCDLRSMVSKDLEDVEALISCNSNNTISYISEIIQHLILSGGKRLRPILLLSTCGMFGCSDARRIMLASAVELIHSATLLHDDVIDKSDTRRGAPTSNKIWGNKACILVGDFLFAVSFQWLVMCNSVPLLDVLSKASCTIVSGEIQQMIYCSSIDIARDKYLEIISAKTAALFSASCEAAALVSNATDAFRSAVKNFGYHFGIAFQILDDVLDHIALEETLGKSTLQDIGSGKTTLPLIIAYENASTDEKKILKQSLSSKNPDVALISSYIAKYDGIEKAVSVALDHIAIAKAELAMIPDSKYKMGLYDLLESAAKRQC